MASYVSDCQNVYVDQSGDSGMNNNYTTYSSASDAMSACLTNNNYYSNNFTDYGPYGSCSNATTSDNDGSGYVSDGVNVWIEGTAQQNQEGGSGGVCEPDCLSSEQACKQGETWPLLLNNLYGTDYQLYSNEGFKLFDKPSVNIALVIFILLIVAVLIYYFVLRKK